MGIVHILLGLDESHDSYTDSHYTVGHLCGELHKHKWYVQRTPFPLLPAARF